MRHQRDGGVRLGPSCVSETPSTNSVAKRVGAWFQAADCLGLKPSVSTYLPCASYFISVCLSFLITIKRDPNGIVIALTMLVTPTCSSVFNNH